MRIFKSMAVAMAALMVGCVPAAATTKTPVVLNAQVKSAYDLDKDVNDIGGVSVGAKVKDLSVHLEYLEDKDNLKSYQVLGRKHFGNPYVTVGAGYADFKNARNQPAVMYGVGYGVRKWMVNPTIEIRHTHYTKDSQNEVHALVGLEYKF